MYICDVSKLVAQFSSLARSNVKPTEERRNPVECLKLIQDPKHRRLATTVDMDLALRLYNVYR